VSDGRSHSDARVGCMVWSTTASSSADAPDLLNEQVERLGGPSGTAVGDMPGKDLGLPRPDGASQLRQLRYPCRRLPASYGDVAGADVMQLP
jgi:hypothetical protein